MFFNVGGAASKNHLLVKYDDLNDSFTENIENIDTQHWSPEFAVSPPKQKRFEYRGSLSANKPRTRSSSGQVLKTLSQENIEQIQLAPTLRKMSEGNLIC